MPKDTLAAVMTVRDINYYRIKKVASRGLRPGIRLCSTIRRWVLCLWVRCR